MKVGGVQSAEASETSSTAGVTSEKSALGAFSALLEPDSSGSNRPILSRELAHDQGAGRLSSKKRSQASRSAGLSTNTRSNTGSKTGVSVQFTSSPLTPEFGNTYRAQVVTQAAEKIASGPLNAVPASQGVTRQNPEIDAPQPRSATAIKSTQDTVENDGIQTETFTDQILAIGDPQPGSRQSLSTGSARAGFETTNRNSESTGEAVSPGTMQTDSGSAATATTSLLAAGAITPSPAEVDIASLLNGDGVAQNPASNVDVMRALQEGTPPGGAAEHSTLTTQTPSRDIAAVQGIHKPAVGEDSSSGEIAQSGPQIASATAGGASQHHESSGQSSAAGSTGGMQRTSVRGVSDTAAFTPPTSSPIPAPGAPPAHHEALPTTTATLQPMAQHLFDTNQAKALQNSMRDLRVGVQTESFGRVTVQAVTEGGQLSAQVLLENGKQSAVLAAQLPVLEHKLSQHYGMSASVVLASSGESGSGATAGRNGNSNSSASRQPDETSPGRTQNSPLQLAEPVAVMSGISNQYSTSMLDVTV